MKTNRLLLLLFIVVTLPVMAQRAHNDKLSPLLRRLVRQEAASRRTATQAQGAGRADRAARSSAMAVCAFVRVGPGGEDALRQQGCRVLERMDDICIASIPVDRLAQLSADSRILRMEARRGTQALTDTMATILNAWPVYEGLDLPQAYTGRGVVVGLMDVGFDLTHPNFYSRDTTDYRIRRFWDMLSADTVGSTLYVGRDYSSREEMLAVAHARDGLMQTHGTHTLGIAAGSGYDTDYRGMAPEADICIVANAVSSDTVFISPDDYYKYTFATDALGFKYIADYARSQGKPCVLSFSEGSMQDFWGYDLLYYEMLSKLVGPGCILVVAAGNYGHTKTWFPKPAGEPSCGTFLRGYDHDMMVTMKSAGDFGVRLVAYSGSRRDTLLVGTQQVTAQPDSLLTLRMGTANDSLTLTFEAYPSCYDAAETCYDLLIEGDSHSIGGSVPLSVEVVGEEPYVEVYRADGYFTENALNAQLNAGETDRSILSPASAPFAICVGGMYYRNGVVNYLGQWQPSFAGFYGERDVNSSLGPTFDGRVKPDVMAPGVSIISSYSSYYIENNPDSQFLLTDVTRFDFRGRTYSWNANSGTSMACPAVAGAIALWLEAKPDLTPSGVMDVLSHTCRQSAPSLSYPNNAYGYGEIDVYRGLLYLLEADRIEGVSARHTKARIALNGNGLTVDFGTPSSSPTRLRLFALGGQQLFATTLPAGTSSHAIALPSLPAAVYVVQVDGEPQVAGSTLVRAGKN